jgi:hypothetical protein
MTTGLSSADTVMMGDSSTDARTLRLDGVSTPLLSIPVCMKPSTNARSRKMKAELAALRRNALGSLRFGIGGQFRMPHRVSSPLEIDDHIP